ncbi:MAG: T9SS type A sorting domain-containing protein, partial [Chitinophagales bacterium]
AANWEGDVVPTANDEVRTLANHDVIIPVGYAAVAQTVVVAGYSTLTIEADASLTIENSTGTALLLEANNSALTNNGVINIINSDGNGMWIKTNCDFDNNGTVNIESTGQDGIHLGGVLDNAGAITIGPDIGVNGVEMYGGGTPNFFNNLVNGTVNILDAGPGDHAFGRLFPDGTINNDGVICIEEDNIDGENFHQEVIFNNNGTLNLGACVGSHWEVADIISDCNAASATYDICYTATNINGVIGVDFDFSYPDELTPVTTNFITFKDKALEAVSGDASQIEVYSNTDVSGQVSTSIYFDFSAPLNAEWTGGGEFVCFSFILSGEWNGTASTETIVTNNLVESYATGVGEKSVSDASIEIITMLGQIYVNGDETLPLVNGENFNGTTDITTADADCESDDRWTQTFNTENDGEFSIAAAGSENLRITRNTTENDLSIIGGVDALRAVFIRLGLGDAPTLQELLAMDVNGDGFASAGDITNILRRAVGLIGDYPVQAGEVASDWKFATAETTETLEAGSYDWKTVPVLPQCIAVPADPCAQVYKYDAILKGDILSSWAATSAFKTAVDRSLVVDVENKSILELEETYRIPIYAKDSESFFTLDLDLPFDATKVSIEDVVLTEVGASYDIQYVWNTPEEGRLMMASYTIQEIDTDEPLFEIVVKENVTAEDFGAGKSYFNGVESGVEVTGTAVGIEDILNGGRNLTAISSVQPNPASSFVTLAYNTELSGQLEVNVMDLAGRSVLKQNIGQQGRVALDLSVIQNGLYIVTLSEDGQLKGRAKLMVAK